MNPIALLLVQLYACTNVGMMSLQLDFPFGVKVPSMIINELSEVLPFPSLGDGLSTGPTALWIENSDMAADVVVVFIYKRA